ncbi:MAG: glutathione S-transferase N-terminal domain-containing protein [Gammaproteobacteria bacterium]|nr:glutathione S-transferase N-terminal domain-containing protein [Gammaproteobacteria bacterium]
MALATGKRSVMTLFSGATDPFSHRARIVLNEKNVTFEVKEVTEGNLPEDLIDLNPYNSTPTLVDRDLVLFQSQIIMEYLDERFPHPPLMPVDPVSRARSRMMLYRIDRDWYSLVTDLESGDAAKKDKARKEFRESVMSISPVFEAKPYFMSDEFSLVDCSIAPLLWRLDHYGIELPSKAIAAYMERVFNRESFIDSLSSEEKVLRK